MENQTQEVKQPEVEVSHSPKVSVEVKEITTKSPEELMARLNAIGKEMREFIVECKKLPTPKGLGPHQEPVRSIALSQSHLQTGFMWLRRAISPDREF